MLLSVPILASPFLDRNDPLLRSSVPPGDEEWISRSVDEPEIAVIGDQVWSASGGVWHLEGDLWVRNGTVPEQGVAFSPDGTMWLHTTASVLQQKLQEAGTGGEIRRVLIQDNGTVWACAEGLLLHFDGSDWASFPMPTELGVVGCEIAETADEVVWVGTFNAWEPWEGGLARFDGTDWEVAYPFGADEELPVVALTTGPDGELWGVFVGFDEIAGTEGREARFTEWRMASFDGSDWNTYASPGGTTDRFPVSAVATFDGATWYQPGSELRPQSTARGLVTFDGNRWVTLTEGETLGPTPVGSGTVWLAGPVDVLRVP